MREETGVAIQPGPLPRGDSLTEGKRDLGPTFF